MSWELVESGEALQRVLALGAGSDVVIVDTEFMRRNTFYPQVALVQLCFPSGTDSEKAWLLDPLAIEDPEPLARLLTDPGIIKVLHSPSEDLEVFQHWLGVLPQPLFDTQRAAALVGRDFGMGYRALVHAVCGVDLPKGEQRSDWLQRPLTESQCEYAAMDVTWLSPVWQDLEQACREQDRMAWVLADGRDALAALATANGEYYKRIKSAWKLNPRQLAALVAISNWREQTARRRDRPRNWIIDDKACLQLAQGDPQSWTQLKACAELPPPALRRYGETLLELLAQQRGMPESELPGPLPAPLDAAQRNRLKKLKARSRDIAATLGIAPEILLPGKDYELLLRESAGEQITVPPQWQGWRADQVITPLREALAGGLA